jgi:hypothetical protein
VFLESAEPEYLEVTLARGGMTMAMHAATVLRFVKFPRVSNRPQHTVDGRAWQIAKIEAPFCWGGRTAAGSRSANTWSRRATLRAARWPPAPARP